MIIGDSWTYAVTGDSTGEVTTEITGEVMNPAGFACLTIRTRGTIGGKTLDTAELVFQQNDRSLYACGIDKYGFYWVEESLSRIRAPGVLFPGDRDRGRIIYNDLDGVFSGYWVDWGSTVEDYELVTVPLGTFSANRSRITRLISDSDSDSELIMEWQVSKIGVVRQEVTLIDADWEVSTTLVFTLIGYNLAK